jgi:glucose 1-dehydrogenase
MIDLRGHAALVTGSTSGVGRAIALSLAQAGADVVIHGHENNPAADDVVNRCQSLRVKASLVINDLSMPGEAAIDELYDRAIEAMPHVDILASNAGAFYDVPFEQMSLDRFERTIRLNVTAGYFLTQRFARHWIASNVRGRVLFTGSINGRLAELNATAYDTSKGAVEMMVKSLSVSLAPKGIRVNGIAPGLVRTNATKWLESRPEKAAWIAKHTPNGQIPDPSVCGPAAAFLVSDLAEHVHGQMLLVDGGMSALQQPEP